MLIIIYKSVDSFSLVKPFLLSQYLMLQVVISLMIILTVKPIINRFVIINIYGRHRFQQLIEGDAVFLVLKVIYCFDFSKINRMKPLVFPLLVELLH